MLKRPLRFVLRAAVTGLAIAAAIFTSSCVNIPEPNPAFPLTIEQAGDELASLRANPKPLPRPVVVLGGYHSPKIVASNLAATLRELTGESRSRIIAVSYSDEGDIPAAIREADRAIRAALPEVNSGAEIDIVGISMGGLVARALAGGLGQAAESDAPAQLPGQPLNVRRIFTLASPHRGAILAEVIALEPAARDMRGGSKFLAELDTALPSATFELICYGRPRDTWVGATRTAPPGRDPIWTSGRLIFTHFTVHQDERILADLARRLREEPPLGQPSPPPRD